MMNNITMSKKEISKISILEQAMNNKITNGRGAVILGISTRHFRRLKSKYKKYGVAGLAHKLRGSSSNRAISQYKKDYAIQIIKTTYPDFGPTFAHEKLVVNHGISFSVETLRKEMIKAGVWKPKAKKKSTHQMRDRRFQVGELVQIDGSPHAWFENRANKCVLLVYIDDATSKLLWLQFVDVESTKSYFSATHHYLVKYGRPLAFYADKHSTFRVNTTNLDSSSTNDSNGITQFGRAMEDLDIEMIFANSAQAKGRVERANQTLQDRLIKEMRLLGISSIEEGNDYLQEYIKIHNHNFAVTPDDTIDAHRPLLTKHNLDEIFTLKETRVISKSLELRYKTKTYQISVKKGYEYTLRRAKVLVLESLDGGIKIQYRGKNLNHSIIEIKKNTKTYNSKTVNKRVDTLKKKQGRRYQFNLLGRTFLLWTRPDFSTLG